ncbi:cytochrome c oxidase subunit I [Hydrocarboniclastica marina]|uniref:cytochrome-c oxidase n=1 Tax=Hydrocarboniclastica marina TaxID=2259620 RepID=A0A4P7XJC8_9ALTE|nr:cytochrome c oxidase subunit I [Hydrocarboniclastica marina]QCF26875.1 cytochrome c oxidase subunit I [Hydrocarboniclastica marina]
MTETRHKTRPYNELATETIGTAAEALFERTWAAPKGLRAPSAVNNSIIGRRFIVTGFVFFLIGGIFALLMRTQLMLPENDFLSTELYNQFFTMHGTTMMFLFAVPVMEAFGVYLIPSMIGSRDLCFPRLGAFGYWCYLFGGIMLLSSALFGAMPDAGWFMYVPLSTKEFSPQINQDFWLLGVTFVEISSIAGAVELITSIVKSRAPGMALSRMPIFAWYMLAVSFMIIFGFPPLVLGSILLEAERAFGVPFFDVQLGGDPLLWQHLFWIFGHPEVYIIFLPAAGLISAMLPAFARSRLIGHHLIVLAVVGTAFLSFGLWVHHMYATGISRLALSFFAGASLAVSVPSGIQVFAWIATIWNGKPVMRVPMLFIIGFVVTFVIGGLTGVMVAMVPFDLQAHDSYFVVAHFHYVLIGGMVFPLFAALIYYLPRATGRMMSETLGKWHFWLFFIGFNVAFFPMHLTGLLGMPRRVANYPEGLGWSTLNMVSTLGSYLLAAGVLVFIVNFVWHLRRGRPAGTNPWDAHGLEWSGRTPVLPYNTRSTPKITSLYPLWDQTELSERIQGAQEYLPKAEEGKREILGSSPVDAVPDHVMRLPHPTFTPLLAAIATSLIFGGLLASVYWLSGVGLAAFCVFLAVWLWDNLPEKPTKEVGYGLHLPLAPGDNRAAVWFGTNVFLLVDLSVFLSLIYSFFYLWTSASTWPPVGYEPQAGPDMALSLVLTLVSLVTAVMARAGAAASSRVITLGGLVLSIAVNGALLFTLFHAGLALDFDLRSNAYGALIMAFGIYFGLHILVPTGCALFACVRVLVSGVRPDQSLSTRITALFTYYMVFVGLVVAATIYLSPDLLGS